MRVGRATFAVALALALSMGGGSAAWADPGSASEGASTVDQKPLPPGWELTTIESGVDLTWHATAPVPIGDAMVQFYAGDRLLGQPSEAEDLRSFHLVLNGLAARNLTDLQVRAGGRRLDTTAEPATTAPALPQRAAAALPPNPVDPGTPGPYSTITGEYTLPDVALPGLATPVEMQGLVVAPQGTTGQRPLVVLLHGKHGTCYQGTANFPSGDWPCPAGYSPVPSYRGYLRIQQLLASQGYVTVSLSANGINGQDNNAGGLQPPLGDGGAQARSSLVRLHLGHWADWAGSGRSSAPAIVQSAPVADMTKVLLFGHSRGGEGVSRAAVDSITPPPADLDGYHGTVRWTIRGLALVGPTAFGQNPAPDVPSMTILPGCDGDVSDLPGQMYADATRGVGRGYALHSSVFVQAANHNYFNTEWTPGLSVSRSSDDANEHDPYCGGSSPARLTPETEQNVGATYVAAAAATFLAGNDQVRPLLDGSGVRAPSADPAIVLSEAVGGNRTALLVPEASTAVSGGSGARLCEAVAVDTVNTGCDASSPHFNQFGPIRPEAARYAITMLWTQPGVSATFRPPTPASLSGAQSLALRIAVGTNSTGNQLEVAISDSSGRRASLGQVTLDGMPGATGVPTDWAQEVRMPLTNAVSAGLNLNGITTLELIPRNTPPSGWYGRVWLIDAWGWRSGTPEPQPTALPRVDLGELTVAEGDSGTVTYQVPARVTGSGSGQVRVFVVDPVTNLATSTLVTVSPGNTTIPIPVQVTGNTTRGDGRAYLVAAKAVQGVAVGDAFGQLTVQDDDA